MQRIPHAHGSSHVAAADAGATGCPGLRDEHRIHASSAFVSINGNAAEGITVQGNGAVTLTASDFWFV